MTRHEMLARVRAALADRPAAADARPIAMPATPVPASLQSDASTAADRFRSRAEAKGVCVVDVASLTDAPRALAALLSDGGTPAPVAVRLGGCLSDGIDWETAGIAGRHGAAEPGDAAGVSQALAGIAETGTVMVASGPDNPTTLAFLPETHAVVLRRSDIVGTFQDAVQMLRAVYGPGQMPRTVNFISGASRTGDIGGRIVHGAHGPRRLIVFLVG